MQTPGLGMSAQDLALYGDRSTIIGVMPTADAPAGTTISWSGFARAGLVYTGNQLDTKTKNFNWDSGASAWNDALANDPANVDDQTDDWDVKARGEIRVKAATDTAVGEVGVDIRMRANFNGNGNGDVYADVAWGYWAMTPELTLGGGYAGSLGNIGYGYDGACTCNYTDNGDVDFNPGDTTQMRLSYGSGPLSFAIAVEDASIRGGGDDLDANDKLNPDELGAAGEIKYSGDTFSGEISGVWRGIGDDVYTLKSADGSRTYTGLDGLPEDLWQVGAGVGFALGDMAKLSLAAAMGEGPYTKLTDGEITGGLPINNQWWGVSALASFQMSDEFHAEVAAGYKNRDGDDLSGVYEKDSTYDLFKLEDISYDTWSVLGGLYYQPVDQLTIGIEAEYYTQDFSYTVYRDATKGGALDTRRDVDVEKSQLTVDLVSVWRF